MTGLRCLGSMFAWNEVDGHLTRIIGRLPFSSELIASPISRIITEILIVLFFAVLSYELIYWTGIYLGLWEYHAKDIFKEIPIHCAHVYVRLNVVKGENLPRLDEFYDLKNASKFNILCWDKLQKMEALLFEFKKFIRYHFEFSPEDFEMNKEPEYGSTIIHLREKILSLFINSEIYKKYHKKKYKVHDVIIFDNKSRKVGVDKDDEYLSKCNIETGNIIDAIILY